MKLAIEGIQLWFNLNRNGLGWCSDWAKVHTLVAKGFLRAEYGGPSTYGACFYSPTDLLLAVGVPWEDQDFARYHV